MTRSFPFLLAGLVTSVLTLVSAPASAAGLDHRDHYDMDSMSGGAFRDYISTHVTEDRPWADAMRTFGSFHNFMHELMAAMARHGAHERGDGDKVPDFEHRISGGQWRDYRRALEAQEQASDWLALVQITEIMHDRVHHAMVKSVLYDDRRFERGANLSSYLRGEPLALGKGIPGPDERRINAMSLDEFRTFAWTYEAEGTYWHQSVQQMIVFAHMLDDMLTQWLRYGATHNRTDCRPAVGAVFERGRAWDAYVASVARCPDTEWREFIQVTGLMRDRIHHMLRKAYDYQTGASE